MGALDGKVALVTGSSRGSAVSEPLSRRDLLRTAALGAVALALPGPLAACSAAGGGRRPPDPDRARLIAWTTDLRTHERSRSRASIGRSVARAGELAIGSPYEPFTLEAYIRAGGNPSGLEPLTLSLSHFDCATLVESCLAVARVAAGKSPPTWEAFGHEIERMRYRGGRRQAYASRLHYFSEWIADGQQRGLLTDLGATLGGVEDARPLRFMTQHRASYPALVDDAVFHEIGAMEHSRDGHVRYVVPTAGIAEVADRIETGDVLAFATEMSGLDVTHAAFAYRDPAGALRVLHAPLSGGRVEISRSTLPEYVAAIRRSTGILVARPLIG